MQGVMEAESSSSSSAATSSEESRFSTTSHTVVVSSTDSSTTSSSSVVPAMILTKEEPATTTSETNGPSLEQSSRLTTQVKEEPVDNNSSSDETNTVLSSLTSLTPAVNSIEVGWKGTNNSSTTTVVSSRETMSQEEDHSPPATLISLTPVQPAYDVNGTGQFNGIVYLTTDYNTYRDYYTTAPTAQTTQLQLHSVPASVPVQTSQTLDQYQAVRQQLTTTPTVTYTAQTVTDGVNGVAVSTEATSFLDRYLRQPPTAVTSSVTTAAHTVYNSQLQGGLTVDLPSPDSGIGEAIVTPRAENGILTQTLESLQQQQQGSANILPVTAAQGLDQSTATTLTVAGPATPGSTGSNSNASTPSTTPSSTKSSRRSWHEYGRNSEVDKVQIPKIFSDVGFKYYLESPISTSQRREDDRITYINKGQFYGVTLEYIPDPDRPLKSATVKTLMLLVFREEKSHEDEIKAWQFWHSRQHSIKQRILDADTKNSSGIIGPIEEVTHNSISFYWNPLDGPAKINVAVQCLSTDFSNQKGVKGLPLHLQIDTFDDIREGAVPINRGYCQIKVFCDKGAERKTRDEERRAAKRKLSATGNGRKKIEDMYHPTVERSEFYTMADVLKPAVLFTPSEELEKQINAGEINFYAGQSGTELNSSGYESSSNGIPSIPANTAALVGIDHKKHVPDRVVDPLTASVEMAITQPPVKRMKIYPQDRVLIYAKQENEEVFHPLHLVPPSLVGLAVAIQNKYKLEAKNIRHIFKRCRKGITVQMDDDMVKHYSNEDTCLLEVHQVDEHTHDITLVEYDAN